MSNTIIYKYIISARCALMIGQACVGESGDIYAYQRMPDVTERFEGSVKKLFLDQY